MRIFALSFAIVFCSTGFAQDRATEVPRPLPRPQSQPIDSSGSATSDIQSDEESSTVHKPDNPARIYQTACPALLSGLIEGKMLPPLREGACGLQSPLLVQAVNVNGRKVGFTSPVTTNCQMAATLANWVAQISDYTQAIYNEPVTALTTGTSYMCRTRNNQPGADQSEHGFANAVDVVGFVIGEDRRIGLPDNWSDDTSEGRTMRFAHGAACGQFTTVLGPEANPLHRDHLHVDLGCHGKKCTYRLCE